MESFPLWRARMAALHARDDREQVLFLAYQSASESEASAAGLEYVGITWDASGVQVKAYRLSAEKSRLYSCSSCGKQSKIDQGMYCCGKKRVPRS